MIPKASSSDRLFRSKKLWAAARIGDMDTTYALTQEDPTLAMERDWRGDDALTKAIIGRHEDVADLLIPLSDTKGANRAGSTALSWAARVGSSRCIIALLSRSNPHAIDASGLHPFGIALMCSMASSRIDSDTLFALARATDPKFPQPHGHTPLELAEAVGDQPLTGYIRSRLLSGEEQADLARFISNPEKPRGPASI